MITEPETNIESADEAEFEARPSLRPSPSPKPGRGRGRGRVGAEAEAESESEFEAESEAEAEGEAAESTARSEPVADEGLMRHQMFFQGYQGNQDQGQVMFGQVDEDLMQGSPNVQDLMRQVFYQGQLIQEMAAQLRELKEDMSQLISWC